MLRTGMFGSFRAWVALALGFSSTLPADARDLRAATRGASGQFSILTYNVAGLPEGLSNSHPLTNLSLIGELLNRYDLALVQEDFAYPNELRRNIRHAYGSRPFVRGNRIDFGDGLSEFSRLPFTEYLREPWKDCHGLVDSYFDCWTPKGFSITRLSVTFNLTIDVYNVHMDAGFTAFDINARESQVDQLLSALERLSAGRPVILAGDTNIPGYQRTLLNRLIGEAGLTDSCEEVHCAEPNRIDRVLYRSTELLELRAKSWRLDRTFVDAQRRPLSDHRAVAVELAWSAKRSER